MVQIVLPDLVESFSLNKYFYRLAKTRLDIFKVPTQIIAVAGNLPYSYWDGTHCNMIGNGIIKNLPMFFQQVNFPIRLICNNMFLQEYDFVDTYNQVILNYIQFDAANQIVVNDPKLKEYIKAHFLFQGLFLTENEEDILPFYTITQQQKEQQHKYQYNFQRKSAIFQNKISPQNIHMLTEDKVFEIPPLANILSYADRVKLYVDYFIKPEYQFEIFAEIVKLFGKEIGNDIFYYSRAIRTL